MARFSERIGLVDTPKTLQINNMSKELRSSLWNFLHSLYENRNEDYWLRISKHVAQFFRKVPVDELPYQDYECRRWLKAYFYELQWYAVYDLIEFVVNKHQLMTRKRRSYGPGYDDHAADKSALIKTFNYIFERELSGYRFISGVLSPISDKAEVNEIEDAIKASEKVGLHGDREHIRTALELLGKKPEPDYRNAIKEAISSVESVAKQISGANSQGLNGALNELSKVTEIHRGLKSGFRQLYGYSSDESGIRHAILDETNVGFAEAKYMIVSCSAFINYLIAKADAAGLFGKE